MWGGGGGESKVGKTHIGSDPIHMRLQSEMGFEPGLHKKEIQGKQPNLLRFQIIISFVF